MVIAVERGLFFAISGLVGGSAKTRVIAVEWGQFFRYQAGL